MAFTTTPSGASCGATIDGLALDQPLSSDLIAELRAQPFMNRRLVLMLISAPYAAYAMPVSKLLWVAVAGVRLH